MKYMIVKSWVLVFGLWLGMATAGETTLPAHYPAAFHVSGVVHEASNVSRQLNLDGVVYSLAPDLVVYNQDGERTNLHRLIKGSKVGVNFEAHVKGKRIVKQIWLLPSNFHVEPHAG